MSSTKTCYLDANFLVFFQDKLSEEHGESSTLLKILIKNEYVLFISPLTLDEFIHSVAKLMRRRKQSENDIYLTLRNSLSLLHKIPNLTLVNPLTDFRSQLKVLSYMQKYSLKPRDAYHFLIMKSNGIKYFSTFDRDFDTAFERKAIKKFVL